MYICVCVCVYVCVYVYMYIFIIECIVYLSFITEFNPWNWGTFLLTIVLLLLDNLLNSMVILYHLSRV